MDMKVRAVCDVTSINAGWGHVNATLNLVKHLKSRGCEISKLEFIVISEQMEYMFETHLMKDPDFEKTKKDLNIMIKRYLGDDAEFAIIEPDYIIKKNKSGELEKFDLFITGAIDCTVLQQTDWNTLYENNFNCKTGIVLSPPGFLKSVSNHVKHGEEKFTSLKGIFLKSDFRHNVNVNSNDKNIVIYKPDRCQDSIENLIKLCTSNTSLKNVVITIITGNDVNTLAFDALQYKLRENSITFIPFQSLEPDKFKEQLLKSDLCICEGQNTASECVSYGVPVLHTPISNKGKSVNDLEKTFKLENVNNISSIQNIEYLLGHKEIFREYSEKLQKNGDLLDEALKIANIQIQIISPDLKKYAADVGTQLTKNNIIPTQDNMYKTIPPKTHKQNKILWPR